MNFGLAGRFRFVAYKLDGSSRVVADWFDNIVLNNGLNLIGSGGGTLNGCFVGTGTSTPVAGQTSLDTPLGATGSLQTQTDGSDVTGGFCWLRGTYRFTAGQATGNLSEVGVGAASNNLFSRARILDGSGNPTTVTILADEVLDVTYEIRVYWPSTDTTGTVNIPGVGSTAFTVRPYNVGAWRPAYLLAGVGGNAQLFAWGWSGVTDIGPVAGSAFADGTPQDSTSSWTWSAYSSGSYSRTGQATFPIGGSGVAFNGILFYNSISTFGFKARYASAIPKTVDDQVRVTLQLSWSRRSI